MFWSALPFRTRRSGSHHPSGSVLRSALLVIGAVLATAPATAQEEPSAPSDSAPEISGQISGGFLGAVPRGGLQRNIDSGGGFRLYLGDWVGSNSPVVMGVDIGLIGYGRTTEQVPFSSTVGPRVPVEVTTNNNVLETHLSVRLQRREGRLRPYVEALAGFKYLFTRTSVGSDDFGNDGIGEELTGTTNFDDFALSGGAGMGLDIRLYQPERFTKQIRAISLHLGVQYVLGQEAQYLAEGALTDENGNGQLDRSEMNVRRSRTTFLQPQVGVTIRLSDAD